jgi:hypothetical protein
MAIYRIRLGKSFSLKDIRSCFEHIPACYTQSDIMTALKDGRCWPSSFLKPEIDASGICYQDMSFTVPLGKQTDGFILEGHEPKGLMVRLTLTGATGVPLPTEKVISRPAILQRRVAVYLWDDDRKVPASNVQFVDAGWD